MASSLARSQGIVVLLAVVSKFSGQTADVRFESLSLAVGLVNDDLGSFQLGLIHDTDGGAVGSPSASQKLQVVGELAVLSLEEADFLDVAGQTVVEIGHFLLLTFTSITDGGGSILSEGRESREGSCGQLSGNTETS